MSSMSTDARRLIPAFDRFLATAAARVEPAPWQVVIAMHEVFRNLWPADPFIPFDPVEPAVARIHRVLRDCTDWLTAGAALGSYFESIGPEAMGRVQSGLADDGRRAAESETQRLYGALWDRLDIDVYINETRRILDERFAPAGFSIADLAGLSVIDQGCGSGRYAIAIAAAGAKQVVAVDLGAASIERARAIARDQKLTNIEFRVADVLSLPVPDASVDFVFSNGVLHHTADPPRGLREIRRVLRPGGRAFLYLYGDGGLFWHARKAARAVMQRIPRDYATSVLDGIGMPGNRFIFADTWYVSIERHIGRYELEAMLRETGFASFRKLVSGRATDLDSAAVAAIPDAPVLWGDGEHRYLLQA